MNAEKAIKDYLISKYGEVKPEWEITISMMLDNIQVYDVCKKSIVENGIYDPETGKKNPLLITMRDLQVQILKCIKELGLSPLAASKIKNDIVDDEDDFIESLTNG